MEKLDCFKPYDIRGIIGKNINEEIVYRIARAFLIILKCRG